jgi:uncharacterized protein YfiM (DUF2279 family)
MKKLRLMLGLMMLLLLALPLAASAQSGITYDSGFQVQNLDASNKANITIVFYNQDGTEANSVNDEISAGGSNNYYPLDEVSSGFNGSVVISSDRDIRAIANVLGNGTDFGASYGGFTAGATEVSIPLLMKENNGFNTWFNVQNTGSAATDVTINYSDGETESCLGLEPGAACTLDQSTEGHALGWVGSATVTADEPVAVTVMEVGDATLFAYSGFTGGSTELAMPLINANNSGYITGVQIQNMGGTDTDVTVSYTPSAAGTACSETQTVEAGKSATFALSAFTADGDCGDAKFIGSATVTANSANQDLVAIVNQLNLGANKGAAYEAFDPASATDSVVMPLIMDRNSGYFTGFSVLNVGTSSTTVNCTFVGSSHTESETLDAGEAMAPIQNGVLADGYVGAATCTAGSGGEIVGIVNELNVDLSGDAFLVYDAFNQ